MRLEPPRRLHKKIATAGDLPYRVEVRHDESWHGSPQTGVGSCTAASTTTLSGNAPEGCHLTRAIQLC